jgi:hypothetical protein
MLIEIEILRRISPIWLSALCRVTRTHLLCNPHQSMSIDREEYWIHIVEALLRDFDLGHGLLAAFVDDQVLWQDGSLQIRFPFASRLTI